MEECDVCKGECEACNDCWDQTMPEPEPPSMDEFPGTDGTMEGEPGPAHLFSPNFPLFFRRTSGAPAGTSATTTAPTSSPAAPTAAARSRTSASSTTAWPVRPPQPWKEEPATRLPHLRKRISSVVAETVFQDCSLPPRGGHFCDHHDPEEFPCCQKSDHAEQDECLQASGTIDTGAAGPLRRNFAARLKEKRTPADDVAAGGSSHTMEMDGAEYENPCQEPCFECDMCWQNESKQEEAHACFESKASPRRPAGARACLNSSVHRAVIVRKIP